MKGFKYKRYLFVCLWIMVAIGSSKGQDFKANVTRNFFIKDAKVVQAPGMEPVLTSLRIKDGIIDDVGSHLAPSYNEKVIQADSQYVYAGFIDALSHAGIKKEEEKREERRESNRSTSKGLVNYEQSGITPQVSALTKISAKDASIGDLRKSGFVLAQVFPRGRMVAGSSTLLSLGEADHEDKLVVSGPGAMLASFTTASGVAPATVIGVIAKFKELFKNTSLYHENELAYLKNPLGIKKPGYSEELAAMLPLHKKQMNLYFMTPKSKDIFRAIELHKQSGYTMILSDIQHLTPALSKVKAGGYAIVLSTQLPEEVKEEKKEKDNPDKKKEEKSVDNAPKSEEELALEKRKQESLQDYLGQAALCEKNNISFAFGTASGKSGDVLKNIRRMVKAGLSEKAALSALTTTPAAMLQLSNRYGTIEKGKVASFVFFDKPMFDEKATVKQVWVEGTAYINEEKPKSESKGGEASIKPEGNWTYSAELPGQAQTGKFIFRKDGKSYSGTSIDDNSPGENFAMEDLVIDGNVVKFKIIVDPTNSVTAYLELTFGADNYSGTVTIDSMGSFAIKGNKISGPNF